MPASTTNNTTTRTTGTTTTINKFHQPEKRQGAHCFFPKKNNTMSFEKRFPQSEGWVSYKLTLMPGHDLTEQQLKEAILAGRNEDDYELGHLSCKKTVARLIMRKKTKEQTQ